MTGSWEEWFNVGSERCEDGPQERCRHHLQPGLNWAGSANTCSRTPGRPSLKISGMNAAAANPVEETVTFVYEELYME